MALLTVEELREHVNSDLSDDALTRLMEAAESAIIARAGATGERTQIIGGGNRFIALARPLDPSETITVTEQTPYGSTVTTLVAGDFLVRDGGMLLERISTSDNPRSRWFGYVTVTYTPLDDTALRIGVLLDYINAQIDYHPGLTSYTTGADSESYAANSAWNNSKEREAILSRLDIGLGMVVV